MPSLSQDDFYGGDDYDFARVAAVIGVNLVGQVLQEASSIANAAQTIGWPLPFVMSMFKDANTGIITFPGQEQLFELFQENKDLKENDENPVPVGTNTSTPQKVEPVKPKPENNLIGQGDEDFDIHQEGLNNSTSMFINNLFDMSEIEKEVMREEIKIAPVNPEDTNTQMVIKITETLLNNTFDKVTNRVEEVIEVAEVPDTEKLTTSPEESCYSFLADANDDDVTKNIAFYIDDHTPSNSDDNDSKGSSIVIEPLEDEKSEKCDVARYENAYLTLNRDYDQCSEDDGDPVLKDPKVINNLEEVELLQASASENDMPQDKDPEEARKILAATSAISGASGSRKSRTSLMSRCRSQGARLLACLRGWWRRKTPGKRKARNPGAARGLCPLSPDARRRAASLLDHREMYTPPATRTVAWKFNTVNETYVNSSRWKDYSFEVKPSPSTEFEN